MTFSALSRSLTATFSELRSSPWGQDVPVAPFAAFLREDPSRVHRGQGEHFTASAMIFTPNLKRTLLCFHGKGDMWVQLGGHLESGDATAAQGALREAKEESGLTGFRLLSPLPIDLNRHDLAATFGSCRAHWDIVFALTVPYHAPVVSEESKDVKWFDVDALPPGCAPGFPEQFAAVLRRVRSLSATT